MARKKAKDELTLEQEVPPIDADDQNSADAAADQTPPISAGEEAVGVATEEAEGQITQDVEPPSTFTFTADVEHVYDESLPTRERGLKPRHPHARDGRRRGVRPVQGRAIRQAGRILQVRRGTDPCYRVAHG